MKPFFLHPNSNKKDKQEEHPLVPLHEPERNTSEGSEFLDDMLSTEDAPLVYTEESIAAGSPKNLL